jgi:uncharacterized membrane protein
VEVVVEEAAAAVVAPLLGATAGGALGASKRGLGGGAVGALLGLAAGALVHAMIPKAQRLVCVSVLAQSADVSVTQSDG